MYWFSCPLNLPSNEDVICLFKLECLNYNIMPFSKVNMYVLILGQPPAYSSRFIVVYLLCCVSCVAALKVQEWITYEEITNDKL